MASVVTILDEKGIEQKKTLNEKENSEFAVNLSNVINNVTPNATITIGKTPNSLIIVGADAEHDLVIRPDTIRKCMREATADEHGHLLSEDLLKALPDELRNPAMILRGSHEGSVVAVSQLKDNENREVVISVEFDSNQDFGLVNRITSAYGRNNFENYLERELNQKNNLIAVNKEKANEMLRPFGLQLPTGNTFISFDNSIAYTLANVKYPSENAQEKSKENQEIITADENERKIYMDNLEMAKDKNTSVDVLGELAKDSNEDVREENAEILAELVVRREAARNESTPVAVLAELAKDEGMIVRMEVARNMNTPAEVLAELAKDEDIIVRMEVAKNKNTPVECLYMLAKDKNTDVCMYAQRSLKRVGERIEFPKATLADIKRQFNEAKKLIDGCKSFDDIVMLKDYLHRVGRDNTIQINGMDMSEFENNPITDEVIDFVRLESYDNNLAYVYANNWQGKKNYIFDFYVTDEIGAEDVKISELEERYNKLVKQYPEYTNEKAFPSDMKIWGEADKDGITIYAVDKNENLIKNYVTAKEIQYYYKQACNEYPDEKEHELWNREEYILDAIMAKVNPNKISESIDAVVIYKGSEEYVKLYDRMSQDLCDDDFYNLKLAGEAADSVAWDTALYEADKNKFSFIETYPGDIVTTMIYGKYVDYEIDYGTKLTPDMLYTSDEKIPELAFVGMEIVEIELDCESIPKFNTEINFAEEERAVVRVAFERGKTEVKDIECWRKTADGQYENVLQVLTDEEKQMIAKKATEIMIDRRELVTKENVKVEKKEHSKEITDYVKQLDSIIDICQKLKNAIDSDTLGLDKDSKTKER